MSSLLEDVHDGKADEPARHQHEGVGEEQPGDERKFAERITTRVAPEGGKADHGELEGERQAGTHPDRHLPRCRHWGKTSDDLGEQQHSGDGHAGGKQRHSPTRTKPWTVTGTQRRHRLRSLSSLLLVHASSRNVARVLVFLSAAEIPGEVCGEEAGRVSSPIGRHTPSIPGSPIRPTTTRLGHR
jgi:hypothetical protein